MIYLERFPCKQDEVFTFIMASPPSSLPGTLKFSQCSATHILAFQCVSYLEKWALPLTVGLKVVQGWNATALPPQRETVLRQAPFCPWASPLQLLFLILTSLFLEIWNTHITWSQVIKANPETFHKQNTFYSRVWETVARWGWYLFLIYVSTQEVFFYRKNTIAIYKRKKKTSGKPISTELLISTWNFNEWEVHLKSNWIRKSKLVPILGVVVWGTVS